MKRRNELTSIALSAFLALASCSDKKQESKEDKRDEPYPMQAGGAFERDEAPSKEMAEESNMPAPAASAPMEDGEFASGYGQGTIGGMNLDKSKKAVRADRGGGKDGSGEAEQGPAPRAWFPETFLFDPLIVTDDQGRASVDVRVPDRLTTWRVLGLAHSRAGAQAGGTASFVGTLPAYVDPVVPSFLRVGDTVRVPVQLVNNSESALQTTLKVEVDGGTLTNKTQSLSIPARSSTVRFVELRADKAGTLRLMARMGEQDMVVRTIEVRRTGRPVQQSQSGTLAAPRSYELAGAESVGASKGIARLSVYPGALALLRSELSTSAQRGGMAADAFALLLAGKAPALLRALGDEPDAEALRRLKIESTQKIMQYARVLNLESASLIAEAAGSHPDDPVLERLAKRALAAIESTQAPDGTCGGQSGITLQRLLVSTAECARAGHDLPNVRIRAAGAFERNAKEISDPYTAAAILAAKGASGELAESLRKLVLDNIEERDNGAKVLVFPAGVVRADGQAPSTVEATAMAVLALRDQADAPLADLGATILANYTPQWGWGDGRANLLCMEAAVELFREPLPASVAISLRMDGEVVAQGTLDRDKVREVLQLDAQELDIGGTHQWAISAEPAVPGLGFALTLTNWVPWLAEETSGTELSIDVPKNMRVGSALMLNVQAIAPSGLAFTIELDLPAGVSVDSSTLQALVNEGRLSSFTEADGHLRLEVQGLAPAQRFAAALRLIPTLAGSLQSGPASIRVLGQEAHLPPQTWVVR